MIQVRLMGRCGNQMFQKSAIAALAKRNDTKWSVSPGNRSTYIHSNIYKEIPYIDNAIYQGYFQNSKYFNDYDVSQLFELNSPNAVKFITDNALEDFVSIHVRRGDYLGINGGINLSNNYYNKALDVFKGKQIVFTSDDMNWVKTTFPGHYYSNMSVDDDLVLQTLANYHIISNSSFSWWGSYLSKTKHTIAPSPWMRYDLTSDEILEDSWELILND